MLSEPLDQHRWLQRFVGEWTVETQCVMGPGQAPVSGAGKETVRSIGDLWVVFEGEGDMPGCGMMSYIMTVGYDPRIQKFVGMWAGSPMAGMFVYEGDLDADGETLPLNTQGPSFTDPSKTTDYQDVLQLQSDRARRMWSQAKNDDGSWMKFMTATFRRVN